MEPIAGLEGLGTERSFTPQTPIALDLGRQAVLAGEESELDPLPTLAAAMIFAGWVGAEGRRPGFHALLHLQLSC